jgi:hypothetical protein
MLKLLVLYAHLLATCLALGTIALGDARILARMADARVIIAPPSRGQARIIMAALLLLWATGLGLVALGDASTLSNPKLQGKLLLVTLLCLNGVVLHHAVFPMLLRRQPLASWRQDRRVAVALTVGLSNSLWLYCAFLGIARPWNHTVSLGFVLGLAVVLWAVFALMVLAVLAIGARTRPQGNPDGVDVLKSWLTRLTAGSRLSAVEPRPGFEPTRVEAFPRVAHS